METVIKLRKDSKAATFYRLSPQVIFSGKLTRLGDNGNQFYVFVADWLQPLTLGAEDFEIIGVAK